MVYGFWHTVIVNQWRESVMPSEHQRRFSLDKVEIDPAIKNRIMSADGDEHVGDWDGEHIEDLVKELDRIEERVDASYSNLPHHQNIPEDLRDKVEKDYPVWACDRHGKCLVGENADTIETTETIRAHYEKEYGGVDQFLEKLRIQREQFEAELRAKNK